MLSEKPVSMTLDQRKSAHFTDPKEILMILSDDDNSNCSREIVSQNMTLEPVKRGALKDQSNLLTTKRIVSSIKEASGQKNL
jgi:hypothetical protein